MTARHQDERAFAPARVYQQVMPWLLMLAGAVFGYALICVLPHETCDEGFHAPQIWGLYVNSYDISPALTMLPTYHYAIALVLRQIGTFNLELARMISAAVALLALPVFYKLVRGYYAEEASVRTLQFFFLPIVFPFFFLLYTDLWGLLAVFCMVLFTLRRQYLLSATFGLITLMLRQDNILWVGLAFLLVVFEPPDDGEDAVDPGIFRRMISNCLRSGWPYVVVFALFGIFIAVNHGVAIGDRSLQQARFHVTNFYFFLICSWGLFLPYNLSQLPAILRLLRRPWVVAAVVAGFFIYLGTYNNSHQYNQSGLDFYIRNRLLAVMTASLVWRALLYLPAIWALLSFATTWLPEKRLYWLYALAPLFICLHPVIDVRYYFVPVALLLAWRRPSAPGWELLAVVFYLPIVAYFTYNIVQLKFFL